MPPANKTSQTPIKSRLQSLLAATKFRIIAALILIAVVVAGVLIFGSGSNGGKYKYTYNQLAYFQLGVEDNSLVFARPQEIGKIGDSSDGGQQKFMTQKAASDGKTIAFVTAQVVDSSPAAQSYIKRTTPQDLSNPSSGPYKLLVGFDVALADTSLDKDYNVKASTAMPFTAANVKDNAWQADFTATAGSKDLPAMKGKVITIVSQNDIYRFIIGAVNTNWDNNQAVWQKVFDSLKIDQ